MIYIIHCAHVIAEFPKSLLHNQRILIIFRWSFLKRNLILALHWVEGTQIS